jgi:hypothetical protein
VASASDKAITAFNITSPVSAAGIINEGAKTIAVIVPYGTSVTSLTPVITHTGASISPLSGVPRDFSSPVDYIVTAADGSTETYTVTVTVASSSAKAITGFTITGATGVIINEAAKTIAVTVPYGTDATSLSPAITHTGASISPLSGVAWTFTGPVLYTVTAEDLSTETYTVTVTVATALNSVAEIENWIDAAVAEDPTAGSDADHAISLPPLDVTLNSTQWYNILSAIAAKGQYVTLDLTDCARGPYNSGGGLYSNGTFDPDPGIAASGEQYVTALTLPDAAESVEASMNFVNSTFRHFTALKSVGGAWTTVIKSSAFSYCTALTSVDFPEAITIGNTAFFHCDSLTSVDFPKAETIGTSAFSYTNLTNLSSTDFPKAETIGTSAFAYCTSLTSVDIPAAETIGPSAFEFCTHLDSVSLLVETIPNRAFYNCTSLDSVSLPVVTTIVADAFYNCNALNTVTIGPGCDIDAASGLPNGFKASYDGNSMSAGTYTWDGYVWNFTSP